jgi:hypothetical protein
MLQKGTIQDALYMYHKINYDLHAGLPPAIETVYFSVNEYTNNSSVVIFSWGPPAVTDVRVDYYQYQLSSSSLMITNNISNTSVVISSIPYNENVTFTVTVHNCIGSVSYSHTFIVGKCKDVIIS